MGSVRRTAAAALGVAIALALAAPTAAAQQPPPQQQPPAQSPPAGPPGQSPPSSTSVPPSSTSPGAGVVDVAATEEAADHGLVIVAEKIAVLDRLRAIATPAPPPLAPLIAAVDPGTAVDRADLLAELEALTVEGDEVVTVLEYQEVGLSREVVEALSGPDDAVVARLEAGETGLLDGGPFLSAADDLARRNGRPPADQVRSRVDGAALAAAYLAAAGVEPTTGPTASTPTGGPVPGAASGTPSTSASVPTATTSSPTAAAATGGLPWLWLVVLGVVVAIAVGVGYVVVRGRRGAAAGARYDELLEVSRTLALARTPADVERVAAAEIVRLVGGPSTCNGALVRRGAGGLEVGHETLDGVLVPDRLAEGLLRRVVDTGQPVSQVVEHEPALRSLPSSIVAVPVIGAGRVDGLVVAVRAPERPFTAEEVSLVAKLGPIVAAALDSARHADESTAASLTDPLTEVGNRRKLEKELTELLLGATASTAVVMVDLDHFKQVNDTYGHPAGDAVLRGVAAVLRETVRPGDGVYRYGGEEFALVLPGADTEAAVTAAERALDAVRSHTFDLGDGTAHRVTASLGVAATGEPDVLDGLGLIARADRALYDAKRSGRNRVVAAAPSPA